jgi:hypothetical protein
MIHSFFFCFFFGAYATIAILLVYFVVLYLNIHQYQDIVNRF